MTSLRPWLAAAFLISAPASAAEPSPRPPAAPPTAAPAYSVPRAPVPPPNGVEAVTERQWYGAQTLIADGVSLGVLLLGVKTDETSLMVVGTAGLVLVPPFMHWSHDNVATGFGSLALRVLPPIAGALLVFDGIGYSDAKAPRNSTESAIGTIVLLAWVPTAVSVDAAVLAYETKPVESARTRWRPSLSLVRGGATLGASGAF